MIAEYNRKSFIFGIPGIILQFIGYFVRSPRMMITFWGIPVAGTCLLLVGLVYYAKAKGRHPAWSLFGLLSIIGVIVLGCLEDKSGQRLSESPTTQDMDQVTAPTTSRMAVGSFVLSLLGIIYSLCVPNFILLPLLIFALILGCVALRHIKKSGGLLSGRGFAVAGITISLIFLLLLVIGVIVGTYGRRYKSVDHYNRGKAYADKGEYDQAISDYNKALEIDPGFAGAYGNRAISYYDEGQYDKAWEDVHKTQSLGFQVFPRFLRALRRASGRQR